jgi:hypothetical protein
MKSTSNMFKAFLGAVILLVIFVLAGHVEAAGTWTATGPMPSNRAAHTETLLPNGQVLVAGGYTDGVYVASAALYDPAGNTWSPTGSMTSIRTAHTATLLENGKVLVAGGVNPGVSDATAELYDYTTGLWTPTGSMSGARDSHTATLLPSGKVLIVGGENVIIGCCYIAFGMTTADIYDPVSGTWSPTGSMATPRIFHTATLLDNGKVLAAGGVLAWGPAIASAEIYDPATGTWSFTSDMNDARVVGTSTLLPDGKVMVVGGMQAYPNVLASAELYDPVSGTWTFTGGMGVGRMYHTATQLAGGNVLVAGGYATSYGVIQPTAEIYNFLLGTWSPAVSMSIGRHNPSATLLSDGRVLLAGGWDPSGVILASAEVYAVNQPPTAAPSGGGTYEINSPVALGGTVSDVDGDLLSYKWMEGTATLSGSEGSIVAPPGGAPAGLVPYMISTLPLGEHTITLQVSDAINPAISQDIIVKIIDDIAPTLSPAPDKTILWPANHKMIPVTIFANASDNSGGAVNLSASVASNEPQEGLGDGDTPQDWTTPVINSGIITLQLRAERSGKGSGRIYTITIVATDETGNASTATLNILVPHDKGK